MSETVNVFLEATRLGLRFDSQVHSNLSTEQLWQLPLQTTRTNASDLDGVGKVILRALREQEEESLLANGENTAKKALQLKLEVVKAIIEYKQAENAAKLAERARIDERATLRQLLLEKHAEELKGMTKEQIEARLKELGSA